MKLTRANRLKKTTRPIIKPKHQPFRIPFIHPSWLVLVGLIILLSTFLTSSLFKINQIDCFVDNSNSCPQELVGELSRHLNTTFVLLPLDQIELKIKAIMPQATDISFNFDNPNSLTVKLNLAKPIATVLLANTAQLSTIYSNFTLNNIDQVDNESLTQIEYPGFVVGSNGRIDHDPAMKFIVNLLILLQSSNVSPTKVEVKLPQEINLHYSNNRRIIVSSTVSLARQLTTLQLFLGKDTMSRDLSVLDLRFDKPVLMND